MDKQIKYVIFDCWDTVIKYEEISKDSVLYGIYNHVINKDEIPFEEFKNLELDLIDYYFSTSKFDVAQEVLIRYLCETNNIKLDCSFAHASHDSAMGFKAALVDGFTEFLSYLKSHNIKCSVLSNTIHTHDDTAYLINKNFDISPFEHIICSSDYGFKKPDPRFYKLASTLIGVPCENCMFIGDNINSDVLGAYKSNMLPIYFNCKNKEPKDANFYFIEIKSYKELIEIIEKGNMLCPKN